MDPILIRVRYYQGNVFLATAIGRKPFLTAQSEAGFEPASNALAFRAFPRREATIRRATKAEASTDPAAEPSGRASRGLIETRYFVATPA